MNDLTKVFITKKVVQTQKFKIASGVINFRDIQIAKIV